MATATSSDVRELTSAELDAVSGGTFRVHMSKTIWSFNMLGIGFGFMTGSAASGTAGHALVWGSENDPGTWIPM